MIHIDTSTLPAGAVLSACENNELSDPPVWLPTSQNWPEFTGGLSALFLLESESPQRSDMNEEEKKETGSRQTETIEELLPWNSIYHENC